MAMQNLRRLVGKVLPADLRTTEFSNVGNDSCVPHTSPLVGTPSAVAQQGESKRPAEAAPRIPVLRLRSDLQWQPLERNGRKRWIIRDPLSLRFFYLSDDERTILMFLDKPATLAHIVQCGIRVTDLDAVAIRMLLQGMIRNGLVRIDAALDRLQSKSPDAVHANPSNGIRRLMAWFSSPLRLIAFRVPLVDPTAWLSRTDSIGRAAFSRFSLVLLVVLWCVFFGAAMLRWDRLENSAIDMWESFGWRGVLLFSIAYMLLKSMHELGHAFACHRFGAQCREAGIYIICLMPCFYCDVTDSWKISSRWKRAWIDAAGMYCELWIAVLAGLIWMSTHPGFIHSMALSLFLLGSLGTILVNGNPLLKFDGYYLLSDLLNVPNLSSQSTKAIIGSIQRILSGSSRFKPVLDAPTWFLVTFGLLSWVYRLAAFGLILWTIDFAFHQNRMGQLGQSVVVVFLIAFIVPMTYTVLHQLYQWWLHPLVSRLRMVLLIGCCFAGLWYLFTVPIRWEHQVVGVVVSDRWPVYVHRSGTLAECLKSGSVVSEKSVVYRLESSAEALAIAKLEAAIDELEVKLRYWDATGESKIANVAARATLTESRDMLFAQLVSMKEEAEQLTGTSPGIGRFLAVTEKPPTLWQASSSSWHEHAVPALARFSEPQFLGSYVQRGKLIGWIVRDSASSGESGTDRGWGRRVEAYIDERQLERIQADQPVRMRLSADPTSQIVGHIKVVRQEPLAKLPLAVRDAFEGATGRVFRVVVVADSELPDRWGKAVEGMRVHLSLSSKPENLIRRIERFLAVSVHW